MVHLLYNFPHPALWSGLSVQRPKSAGYCAGAVFGTLYEKR